MAMTNPERFIEKNYGNAEFIRQQLGFEWEDLKSKRILDIGASDGIFEKVAKNNGVEVIALDYDPYNVQLREKLGIRGVPIPSWSRDIEYIQGRANALPFQDESFDFVISHAAPPTILVDSKEEIASIIKEVERILKKGGEFRFGSLGIVSYAFDDRELFTEGEEARFGVEERTRRILDKSLELLQSIDPSITAHENQDGESYYSLIK